MLAASSPNSRRRRCGVLPQGNILSPSQTGRPPTLRRPLSGAAVLRSQAATKYAGIKPKSAEPLPVNSSIMRHAKPSRIRSFPLHWFGARLRRRFIFLQPLPLCQTQPSSPPILFPMRRFASALIIFGSSAAVPPVTTKPFGTRRGRFCRTTPLRPRRDKSTSSQPVKAIRRTIFTIGR